jgi:chromosomal replication initiator protein
VTAHEKDVVSAFRASLAERLGPARFDVWFGSEASIDVHAGRLRICLPRAFDVDWLQSRFRRELDECGRAAAGGEIGIEFNVTTADPAAAGASQSPAFKQEKAADQAPLFGNQPSDCKSIAHVGPAVSSNGRRNLSTFSAFVGGPSNKIALAAAEAAAENPGGLSPVFLHGPTGVGKSHLLEASFDGLRRVRGVKAVMMTAERFTSEYVEAAQTSGLPSFRGKYRGVNALVLDDIQFFCGKKRTCEEVLHTLETVHRVGGQVVLAADRPLSELQELGEPLTSRLQGGAQCQIKPPEYEVRLGVVAHAARRIHLELPCDVREFIASEFIAHARELIGAVNRLKLVSLAERRAPDLELAREAFRDCVRASTRLVQLRDVEQAVCEVLGIDAKTVRTDSKAQSAARPRMLMMWLARKHTRMGLTEIGKHFGNRRHSTVVSAHKKVAQWLKSGEKLPLADRCAGVDEIIRQVEARLRVG